MLIAFEGIDRSGKSTLSVNFHGWLNNECRDDDGSLLIDPHLGDFLWTKEPTFSTEEADNLNSDDSQVDEYQRERIFFESRMRHQETLATNNVVCDRYMWSGIAYARKFSPGCFGLLKELYLSENLFMAPDLYVFVDTPPEVCYDRDPTTDLDKLKLLRQAYMETRELIKAPVLNVLGLGGEQRTLSKMVDLFQNFILLCQHRDRCIGYGEV